MRVGYSDSHELILFIYFLYGSSCFKDTMYIYMLVKQQVNVKKNVKENICLIEVGGIRVRL